MVAAHHVHDGRRFPVSGRADELQKHGQANRADEPAVGADGDTPAVLQVNTVSLYASL